MAKQRVIGISPDVVTGDPAFCHFIEKHGLRENTLHSYVIGLMRYVEFTGCSLSELVAEAEEEEVKRVPLERRKIGERVRGFRQHLKAQNLAATSIKAHLAAVKSFYVNGHSLQIPKLGRDIELAVGVKQENKGLPEREEILKALTVADLRETGIILGIASSGLSSADFVELTVGDFRRGFDPETGITVLDMRRMKTKRDFVTFFSAEATSALNDYLAWRERPRSEKMHPDVARAWEKHRIYSEKDYLICKKKVPEEFLETRDEELRREDEIGLRAVFRHIANRAGIAREKDVWNMFRAHKLRAWFFSTLINNRCPQEHAEIFMGHSSRIGSSNGTYYNVMIPKLKDSYLQYMKHLSLTTPLEVRVIESAGYQVLKGQYEEAMRVIAELQASSEEARKERAEIAAIRNEMVELMAREFVAKRKLVGE